MANPTAPRGNGIGPAPTVSHPRNHHIANSDTLISFHPSTTPFSGNEQPNETAVDALSQSHIDEVSVAYANDTDAHLQLSPASQRTLIDTTAPGSFDSKNSLPNAPQHLDPQSPHAPTLSLPQNTRSIHVPLLALYLSTAPVMCLLVKPIPIL